MGTNGVDIMCLQETKIPDPCYEVRKGYMYFCMFIYKR